MFRRRWKYFELVFSGITFTDKAKMLLLATFFLLPNHITNKDAHTSDTIISLTKDLKLKVNGYHYKLSHPRQLFMITDGYERNIQDWFNITGETFLDIGANIGRYTLMLHDRFKQIHSFEPTQETYDILNYNITMNHIQNVYLHKLAAWSREEQLTFYIKNNPGGNSASMPENSISKQTVNAVRLDTMINQFGKVDLIKIDIEGAEPEALKGLQSILKSSKPVVIVEVLECNNETVYDYMASMGYVLVEKQNRNHLFKPC